MNKFLCALVLSFFSISTFAALFVEGKDYERIKTSSVTQPSGTKVSVIEFFSLGCPWCYRVEPHLQQWANQNSKTILFRKVPVIFNKDWEYYAKAYYAAKALSLENSFVPALYKAILQDKLALNSNKAMVDFFAQQGVERATAESAFNHSPSIDMSISRGQAMVAQYHINAVPAFVVQHSFKTDLQMAKTEDRLFAILDFLIKKSTKPAKSFAKK